MKTIYLISRKQSGYLKRMVAITPKGNLELACHKIEIESEVDADVEKEAIWYKNHCDMIESDKETFDEFYIEIVKELNSFNKTING